MATMNISLPEQMKSWAESQVDTGRYANTSDDVRDIIRRGPERGEKVAALQAKINEGLSSGLSLHTVDDILDMARKRAAALGFDKPRRTAEVRP